MGIYGDRQLSLALFGYSTSFGHFGVFFYHFHLANFLLIFFSCNLEQCEIAFEAIVDVGNAAAHLMEYIRWEIV